MRKLKGTVPIQKQAMSEREVEVGKVGRKWANITDSRYRIDIETLRADGGNFSCPGVCYLDKDAFLSEREKNKLWEKLKNSMGVKPPPGISSGDIRQVMELLGIPSPEPKKETP
jgi:hypothetical protein